MSDFELRSSIYTLLGPFWQPLIVTKTILEEVQMKKDSIINAHVRKPIIHIAATFRRYGQIIGREYIY